VAAAIEIIADHGVAGLTHRRVAERAGVPLAATTYYYKSKFDILAEVSNASMQRYSANFARAAARYRSRDDDVRTFQHFSLKLLQNVAGAHRSGTIAWAETSLDAVRRSESLVLSRAWMNHVKAVWGDIAQALGAAHPQEAARSAIDVTIGLIFVTLALGLRERDLQTVLAGGIDPVTAWGADLARDPVAAPQPPHGRQKARNTRNRILDATIDMLVADGPGAINFRQIALRTGLTPAALGYHFASVEELLRVAQTRLFEESKQRYKSAMAGEHHRPTNLDQLVDMTSVVLQREATEMGRRNLAMFSIWLEAARRPELRPMVWNMIADQCMAWSRTLAPFSAAAAPLDGLLAEAMFAGKLIRILSTGGETSDLVTVRREFSSDLAALTKGTFWPSADKMVQIDKKIDLDVTLPHPEDD
jgi:AcrR family transcriptional regulator